MDIQEYLTKLNTDSQTIFQESILNKAKLGELHNLSSYIYEFATFIPDPQEKIILETVSTHLELSNYSLIIGLYRQAFSSLRLALEMGLGAIYFSANRLELHEWLNGYADIKWSRLIDEENGVFSKRFVKAFFSEIVDQVGCYQESAKVVYRKLSEYVHGNSETWEEGGVVLKYDESALSQYCEYFKKVVEIILLAGTCRYAEYFKGEDCDALHFLVDEFNHILGISKLFGRA